MDKKAVVISKDSYNILKLLAVKKEKFLYELIDESIILLKDKYNEQDIE